MIKLLNNLEEDQVQVQLLEVTHRLPQIRVPGGLNQTLSFTFTSLIRKIQKLQSELIFVKQLRNSIKHMVLLISS